MARNRVSRSKKLENEADVIYTIDMPFHLRDSKIMLINRGEDEVEVIVGNIPVPSKYDLDRNNPEILEDDETMRGHVSAKWIVTETTEMFSNYDWKTSSSKSRNPNYHLNDIYFTCKREQVEDAVITAKKFLAELEEKSLQHAREFNTAPPSPLHQL